MNFNSFRKEIFSNNASVKELVVESQATVLSQVEQKSEVHSEELNTQYDEALGRLGEGHVWDL